MTRTVFQDISRSDDPKLISLESGDHFGKREELRQHDRDKLVSKHSLKVSGGTTTTAHVNPHLPNASRSYLRPFVQISSVSHEKACV